MSVMEIILQNFTPALDWMLSQSQVQRYEKDLE